MVSGYSKTPLVKKLGIKTGYTVLIINTPDHYLELLGKLPSGVEVLDPETTRKVDFIHLFAKDGSVLKIYFPRLKRQLNKEGLMWVSWIKKSSPKETDITESDVRRQGLESGLVDVKICAVDEDWSALKFVYRKKDR